MLELKNPISKPNRRLLAASPVREAEERKQRRMMVIALVLLLVALGFVLYRDRDFWFPETQEAEDQPALPAATSNSTQSPVSSPVSSTTTKKSRAKTKAKASTSVQPTAIQRATVQSAATQSASSQPGEPAAPPINAVTTRTVLPPLEVEVVAGDTHRTLHPGTNSVRVDLQPGAPAQPVAVPPAPPNTASVTSNAAEHVQMSADTAEVVSRPVRPDYPLLARQMKVQGSVILQALIGRDGLIQDLHVLSGPPILAGAAREAVKQWHFKPHYLGEEAVETQAKITVNFTISTN
ncbi:MAG TPA: energy transducer TonB [Candidatus Sulfotelmatobacter sp.]|jgi:protein TonB|nr:energy transducer TonB [Candidatus Sulfotelmatobacter sp.]